MVSEFQERYNRDVRGCWVRGKGLSIDVPGNTRLESFSFEPPQPMNIGPLGKEGARLDCFVRDAYAHSEPACNVDSFTFYIFFLLLCCDDRYYCKI